MRFSDRRASDRTVLCVRGWTAKLPASSEVVAVSATPTSRSKGEYDVADGKTELQRRAPEVVLRIVQVADVPLGPPRERQDRLVRAGMDRQITLASPAARPTRYDGSGSGTRCS